jgi:protein O-GlcNAc transferase
MTKINEISDLALSCLKSGKLQEAKQFYQEILKLQPDNSNALHFLGVVHYQLKQYDLAITYIKKAISLQPNYFDAYNNLGIVLQETGHFDEAISYYQQAIQVSPDSYLPYYNIGNLLSEKNQFEQAIHYFHNALQINPTLIEAYSHLGKIFDDIGQLASGIHSYQYALQLNPNLLEALINCGTLLGRQSKLDEAENYFRKALQVNPASFPAYHNLLFNMCHNSRHDVLTIYNEHKKFAEQYEKPIRPSFDAHDRDPNRKIRIGYVSPDFRKHPVSYFLEPVLIERNKEEFEIYCYSNSTIEDEVTKRFQEYSNHWRTISGMSDRQAVELIRSDRIDILIDLAGHTADSRLLIFAMKPAPVQVSWIGYLATTGLSTMDYKICDNYTDPVGKTEQYYSEQLMRLPECFLCYLPHTNSPEIGPLPALSSGHITFGSFNKFIKLSEEIIFLWSIILKEVPDSVFMLKSISDEETMEYIRDRFTRNGVHKDRITLSSWDSSPKHLESYNLVDIGLDTFPFNGLTTTCEAIWMGVPVITLAGIAYHSSVGTSILSNVGLPELVARTPDEYISIAINLAKDLKKLQSLRKHLRDMMTLSPLCEAKRFTEKLEMCYRRIWVKWCEMR